MPTLRNCKNCGEHILVGDRFCAYCGAEQPEMAGAPPDDTDSLWDAIETRLTAATAGKYEIRGLLGYGGMAAVFLADEPSLDRRVAIKVMSPGLMVDPRLVRRFLQEARTTAQLRHPNIVTIYEVQATADLYYFAMTYFPGRSLEAVTRQEGPLPLPVVRLWLSQAASALGYAHRHGVVHRDVKPSNMLLDDDGNLVVTDFGIAKVRDEESLTRTGMIVGTPAYISPEQTLGREVTGASDQYALGVVAYEMLTGDPPFRGATIAVMQAHAAETPAPLSDGRPDCPPELADLVLRMLEKDPAARWPSMEDIYAQLRVAPPSHTDPLRRQLAGYARGRQPVGSLQVTPPVGPVFEGQSWKLDATPIDFFGRPLDGRAVSWTSSDPSIARVTTDGTVVALRPGSVAILARAEDVSRSLELEIVPLPVDRVVVSPSRCELPVGEARQLSALVLGPAGQTLEERTVTWTSKDPQVVEVTAHGEATALAIGDATLFATCEGVVGTLIVRATPPPVASVSLSPDGVELEVGGTGSLRATLRDGHGQVLEGRAVTWACSDTAVVQVGQDGALTALSPGSAVITAAAEGIRGSVTVRVIPERVDALELSEEVLSVVEGERARVHAFPLSVGGKRVAGREVSWASSSPRTAEVSGDGWVRGASPGSATLTASCEGVTARVSVEVRAVPVSAVAVEPSTPVVSAGEILVLRAVLRAADGRVLAGRSVTWTSENPEVVSVDRAGRLRAGRPGVTVVWATCEGVEGPTEVTVTPERVATVAIVPPQARVTAGETVQLRAEARGGGGVPLLGRTVSWTSSDPTVASVSHDGTVRALAAGRVHLTATCEGRSSAAELVVAPPPVAVVELNAPESTLREGRTHTLQVVLRDARGTPLEDRDISWESSDSGVLRVRGSGRVEAVRAGRATVTARSEGKEASVRLAVVPVPVSSVRIEPTKVGVRAGKSSRLTAVVFGPDGEKLQGRDVRWSTSDPAVARVDSSGRCVGISEGTATITVECEGATADAPATVASPMRFPVLAYWPAAAGLAAVVAAGWVLWPVVAPRLGQRSATTEADSVTGGSAEGSALAAISLFPDTTTVATGATLQLRILATDLSGNVREAPEAAWLSSDTAIVRVSSYGTVEGVAEGTATVTATALGGTAATGGLLATSLVTVRATILPVASLTLALDRDTIRVGESLQVRATARDSTGEQLGGREIEWSSGNPSVASVSREGIVRALAPGSVEVRAVAEGVDQSTRLRVLEELTENVSLTSVSQRLMVNDTIRMQATVTDREGRRIPGALVTFQSSDRSVATISTDGIVTAHAPGRVTITARSQSGQTAAFRLTVDEAPVRIAAVAVTLPGGEISAGATVRALARVTTSGGRDLADPSVQWSSSAPSVASVSPEGVVSAVSPGSAVITASAEGVTGSAPLTVVAAAPAFSLDGVAAGSGFTCGIFAGGGVSCWGRFAGQTLSTPVPIGGGEAFRRVSASGGHACGLTTGGAVRCWGANDRGQLGSNLPTGVTLVTAGGRHTCALRSGGGAVCWGDNEMGQLGHFGSFGSRSETPRAVEGGHLFQTLAAGGEHTCGIATDGESHCWGSDFAGQLGADYVRDRDAYPGPQRVAGEARFVALAAGLRHTCALTSDGRAFCWGGNGEGQVGDGSTSDRYRPVPVATEARFSALSAGGTHTCGVTRDGRALCWGRNNRGQLGDGSTQRRTRPVDVSGGIAFRSLSAGSEHTCGVSSDGTSYCWGGNQAGQLGDGSTEARSRPVRLTPGQR